MTDAMMTTLIADCGSTKAHYVLLDTEGGCRHIHTVGFNALRLDERLPDEVTTALSGICPQQIVHYGAGCIGGEVNGRLAQMYASLTRCGDVRVYSDMYAAARATAGDCRAIVCILGTGSNSCLWDGSDIEANVPALGYILGDEGSGAVLGRRLLGDLYKGVLPGGLRQEFESRHGLTLTDVIQRVYREPDANRFMGTLAPFIHEHLHLPQVEALVLDEFDRFMRRNVMQYPDAGELPIYFVGSVASHFAHQLHTVSDALALSIAGITADPMDGLIKYHSSKHK